MKITDKTVDEIAELAKLEFNGKDKEEIKEDLNNILEFVEKLQEINTDGVEPLIYMNEVEDELREDVVNYTVSQKEALKNAPDSDSDYFKVKKVLIKER